MNTTTTYSDLPPDAVFAFWWYFAIAIICILTFGVLLYLTIVVIRSFWETEKVIPLMLFNLQLAALASAAFFIEQMIALALFGGMIYNQCMNTIVIFLSTLFLGLAVLLNINKWIYFSMRIMAKVKISELEYQLALQHQ
jgi:hypothetical protein